MSLLAKYAPISKHWAAYFIPFVTVTLVSFAVMLKFNFLNPKFHLLIFPSKWNQWNQIMIGMDLSQSLTLLYSNVWTLGEDCFAQNHKNLKWASTPKTCWYLLKWPLLDSVKWLWICKFTQLFKAPSAERYLTQCTLTWSQGCFLIRVFRKANDHNLRRNILWHLSQYCRTTEGPFIFKNHLRRKYHQIAANMVM